MQPAGPQVLGWATKFLWWRKMLNYRSFSWGGVWASALAIASVLCVVAPAQADILFDSNATTGADGAFFHSNPGIMQVITTSGPDAPHTINSFTVFGVRWLSDAATNNQHLRLQFYEEVDSTGGAANALASANLLGTITYVLSEPAGLPAGGGSFNYTLPGVNINTTGNTIGVVARFLDNAQAAYSTVLGARYSTGTPAIGSTDGFIWLDNNLDSTFAGSERTQFLGAGSGQPIATNLRMTIDMTVIPEPVSAGLLAFGGLALLRRRRC